MPTVTLKDARQAAREARAMLRRGICPAEARREAEAALREKLAKRLTFAEAALQAHAAKAAEFRNAKHRKDWLSSLERHAFPTLGRLEVEAITTKDVLRMLAPIWQTTTETATRVRQRTEAVLAWATVAGYRQGDNPARWDANLDHLLPKPNKSRRVKHQPALPHQRLAEFMAALKKREGNGARALEFAILTATRSAEVRGATWDEIDFDQALWTMPAERMKAHRAHRVPLSPQALAILKAQPVTESPFVFPAIRGGQLSDMAISQTVRRMHDKADGDGWIDPVDGRRIVPHGFRSTFKDWCRSSARWPDEVSELQLAHVNSDATRAAYARDELLPQRAKMMEAWGSYATTPNKPGDVVRLRGAV